ncbi:sensor histidine kinase [Arcobacter roscoffensis]|uniref:histidine kinase n=1 Tax=Arcobacter roscoffensis TaxID=2961520 RepID=A0ABY5E5K9_9BACT|nr:cache domain-containing protein [Arcobacter roscoffensis]UTJ07441.1 cache domain-containing protein [Arcobacter roscoffensis]
MIKSNNDKFIIFFIKYAPIIFVIIFSLIATKIILNEKEVSYKKEITELEKEYYLQNKKRVYEEVQRVYNHIENEKNNTEKELKVFIKEKVYLAHNIATKIYEKNKDTKSKEEIFSLIKTTLESIIFNEGRGYFFINDKYGNNVLQPLNKSIEGKNYINFRDKEGNYPVRKMIETIKKKSESFDSYFWYKNNDTAEVFEKIAFYKYFEPYDIIIGTGEYIVDFEAKLKTKILEYIQKIRYANNAYIFVIDYDGKYLAHYKTKLIGKNRINYKNSAGRYLVQDIINFARNNDGEYMTYEATINTDKSALSNKKISYIRKFEAYKWVIGTGFYTENLNKKIEEKKLLLEKKKLDNIETITKISILTTMLLLIISFFISKVLESRLKLYKKEIENKIIENKEKDDLMSQQAKMATMGEMIANIAHQWKQPLSQITTISSGIKMQNELNYLKLEDINSQMDKITKSTKYLSETIDDFKNFFSPHKEFNDFEVTNTINRTLKLLESSIKTCNIKVIREDKDISIKSNENELLQVLVNIIKNASEALENREELEENKFIFIKTLKNDNFLKLEIYDNAKGINEDIIKNVFSPYFTTKGNEGTGIGLYMSKNIVTKSLKGKLSVENISYNYKGSSFNGAKFTIEVPLLGPKK